MVNKNQSSSNIAAFISVLFLCLFFPGCEKKENVKTLAIAQYIDHPGLDSARKGFLERMQELGFKEGEDIKYDFQNAQADNIAVQNIATKFTRGDYDLIFTLATPISQAIKKQAKNLKTPIIYGVITDPISAGLVDSMEKPGDNNTASSDQWPYFQQMELIKSAFPNLNRVGILLNPGEVNTQYAIKQVREAAEKVGLQLIESPIYSINDVPQSLTSIIKKIDIVYIIADNTAMSAAPSIIKLAKENGIPTFAGDPGTFEAGSLIGLGVSYYDLGRQTAELAAKILKGEAKAGDLPVALVKDPDLMVNKKVAGELNISVPQEIIEKADTVIE